MSVVAIMDTGSGKLRAGAGDRRVCASWGQSSSLGRAESSGDGQRCRWHTIVSAPNATETCVSNSYDGGSSVT